MTKTHWDFVLSCYEPLGAVTGGIGTYSRMLLELLREAKVAGRPARVLFLTSARHGAEAAPAGAELTCVPVPEEARVDGLPVNHLDDAHAVFSFGVMQKLQRLQKLGHTFGLIEVPDYGTEGYYPLKARAFGLLDTARVAVRLHSPDRMLHEDNDSLTEATAPTFRQYQRAQWVYRHADAVLYGGEAMLERVASLLPAELAAKLRRKAHKVPHPWPPCREVGQGAGRNGSAQAVEVAFVGRLEYRKGADLLVRAALLALSHASRPVRFHFFGRDTHTFRGSSMREYLARLIPEERREAFVFHDYVCQQALWRDWLPLMDLFAFPSRFENYPNVLLEVLALGRPALVSRHGCMPEIGAPFETVVPFDPTDQPGFARLLEERIAAAPERTDVLGVYRGRQSEVRGQVLSAYAGLLALPAEAERPATGRPPRISFVAAHHNHSRWLPSLFQSIRPQLRDGDEVVVVDDCSRPEEASAAKEAAEAAGHRFLSTPRNSGPSVARNMGAAAARGELLYFVDSDDELEPDTVEVLRNAFVRRPELEVATGFMRAFGDESHVWASCDATAASALCDNPSHCGIVVRRAVFERAGGFDPALRLHVEDWELHMRLALARAQFESVPLVCYRYRVDKVHGRNSTEAERIDQSYEQALRHALGSLSPEQLQRSWPELADLLVSLLLRERRPPPSFDALRYRMVDAVNGLLKRTPLHAALKRTLETVMRERRR
ncbi:MAG: glycosyltransferase [Myxococcales bacterium]|nr:glycosyltransferase [Myxococcales bacterium]